MQLNFEHLGALDSGQLILNDLTIVCGRNNIGKTYLTYALYGFLKTWKSYVDVRLTPKEYSSLRDEGNLEIDLRTYVKRSQDFIDRATERYTAALSSVLAADKHRFDRTTFGCKVNLANDVLSKPYKADFRSETGNTVVTLEKESQSTLLIISSLTSRQHGSRPVPRRLIEDTIKDIIWGSVFYEPFIVSSERTGAVTFRSELNLSKNRLIELAHQVQASDPYSEEKLFNTLIESDYPLPVRDNVDFVNGLGRISQQKSELAERHPDIIAELDEIVGGKYKVTKDGEVSFISGSNKAKMRMGESSSAVRSLTILSYYMKHTCKIGDLLIIDEPELSLHPVTQRRLARLIARLVKVGIKVFITTHSDYFIKEFNTLVMFSNKGSHVRDLMIEVGYTESETLAANVINAYTIREDQLYKPPGNLRRIRGTILCTSQVDSKIGIEISLFDDIINDMNRIQDSIYDILGHSQ